MQSIKLIISILLDTFFDCRRYGCLQALQAIPNNNNFLEVPPWKFDDAEGGLQFMLGKANCKLTPEQTKQVSYWLLGRTLTYFSTGT